MTVFPVKRRRESVLRLKNSSPEKFQLWKDLEGEIKSVLGKYNVELEDIVYDGEKYTKSFTVLYDTSEKVNKALVSSTRLVVEKGIEVEIVLSRDFPNGAETISINL